MIRWSGKRLGEELVAALLGERMVQFHTLE